MKTFVRFPDTNVSFMDRGVFDKSATRLTHFPTFCTDPRTAGGGSHMDGRVRKRERGLGGRPRGRGRRR